MQEIIYSVAPPSGITLSQSDSPDVIFLFIAHLLTKESHKSYLGPQINLLQG